MLEPGHRPGSMRTPSIVWAKQGCRSSWVTEHWRAFTIRVSHHERLTHNEASHICMSFIIIQIVSSSRGVALCPHWIWACSTQAFTWLFPQPASILGKTECSLSSGLYSFGSAHILSSTLHDIFFLNLIAVKAPPVNIQRIDTISFLMITAVFK